jgi:hypothetical protein
MVFATDRHALSSLLAAFLWVRSTAAARVLLYRGYTSTGVIAAVTKGQQGSELLRPGPACACPHVILLTLAYPPCCLAGQVHPGLRGSDR